MKDPGLNPTASVALAAALAFGLSIPAFGATAGTADATRNLPSQRIIDEQTGTARNAQANLGAGNLSAKLAQTGQPPRAAGDRSATVGAGGAGAAPRAYEGRDSLR